MGHDHCHHEGSCSIHQGQVEPCGCCCHHKDGSHSCGDEHKNFSQELLQLADDAWMEVLKEKIKEEILSSSGKHLGKLAKLVSEANNTRWKNKLAQSKTCEDFNHKVTEFFRNG